MDIHHNTILVIHYSMSSLTRLETYNIHFFFGVQIDITLFDFQLKVVGYTPKVCSLPVGFLRRMPEPLPALS